MSGAKDDRLDAFVLADSLRTERHCFHRVQLSSEEMIVLREMSRLDEDLAQSRNRLTNQIREQVMRFHPDLLKFSSSADEPWFWDLQEATGDSGKANSFSLAKARNLLDKHHIRRHAAQDLLQAAKAERMTGDDSGGDASYQGSYRSNAGRGRTEEAGPKGDNSLAGKAYSA